MEKNSIKILFFNAIPLPHSIDIHKLLINDGYNVDFWYLKDIKKLYPWQKVNNNIKYNIYATKVNKFIKLLLSAKESKLVIITGWYTATHVLLALFCKIIGIKYCYWLDVPEQPAHGFRTEIKRWLLNLADALFVTGKNGIEFFVKEYNVNSNKCYDFPYLEVQDMPSEIYFINYKREKDLLLGDKIKILISNRFLPRKGYRTVLNALQMISKHDLHQLQITILGTGPEKKLYDKEFAKLEGHIVLKGWVEYDDYLNFLLYSDLLIHASIHEPFGIPPLDAMRYGKLVIASRGVMSCLDRIEHGLNGYLFDSEDSNSLAKYIKILISNKSMIYQMGKLAQKTSLCFGYHYNKQVIEKVFKNNII